MMYLRLKGGWRPAAGSAEPAGGTIHHMTAASALGCRRAICAVPWRSPRSSVSVPRLCCGARSRLRGAGGGGVGRGGAHLHACHAPCHLGLRRAQMLQKVRHRAPSSLLVGCTALCAALFGIYALMLLVTASADSATAKVAAAYRGAGHHAPILEPCPSPVRAGVRQALLSRPARRRRRRRRRADSSFPADICRTMRTFSISRSSSVSPARPPTLRSSRARCGRRMALIHGLIAFLFNTVILAATINVAAGLG